MYVYLVTEGDEYKQCAGDAMRKCIVGGENRLEQKVDQNFLIAMKKYIMCYEEEGKTCNEPILQHYIEHLQVYGEYLDGKKGEYGKVVEKIPLPP